MSAAAPARHLARGEGSDCEQLHQHPGHSEHIVAKHRVGQHTEIGWQGARGAPAGTGQQVSTINLWHVERVAYGNKCEIHITAIIYLVHVIVYSLLVHRFNNPEDSSQVCLLSAKAGGVGINL